MCKLSLWLLSVNYPVCYMRLQKFNPLIHQFEVRNQQVQPFIFQVRFQNACTRQFGLRNLMHQITEKDKIFLNCI